MFHMFRLPKFAVPLIAFLAAIVFAPASPAESLRADFDLGAHWRANSTARLMAGLAPWYHEHNGIASMQAWKDHSAAMRSMWEPLRAGRAASMAAWREKSLPSTCPVGRTLLYPFSGPDFFNVYWLFPGCETIVMFGL